MYEPVKVEHLSKAQVSRLLNGHSVRVKHHPQGKHTIHLHKEQMKKLAKASAKGGAINLAFDPYQIDNHQHLRHEAHGGSILGSLKKVASSSMGKAVQSQLLNKGLSLAQSSGYISPAQAQMGQMVGSRAIKAQGLNFGKVLSGAKKFATSKLGKEIQGQILNTGLQLGQTSGFVNPQQAKMAQMVGSRAIKAQGLGQFLHKAKKTSLAHLKKAQHGAQQFGHQIQHGFEHAGHQIQHGAHHLGHQIQHGVEQGVSDIQEGLHGLSGHGFHTIKMKPRRGRKPKGGALFTAGGAMYPAGEFM